MSHEQLRVIAAANCPGILLDMFAKHVAVAFPDKKFYAGFVDWGTASWPEAGLHGYNCVYQHEEVKLFQSRLWGKVRTKVTVNHRVIFEESSKQ